MVQICHIYYLLFRYTGKNIREGHKNLNLVDKDYDVVLEIIEKTFIEMNIETETIAEILELIESFRDDCLNREKK